MPLATPERIPHRDSSPEGIVWHKPVGRSVDDFQAIACSDTEGLVLPWAKRDVPLTLNKPGESWCPDCLNIIRGSRNAA